jgi:hypothetical protein
MLLGTPHGDGIFEPDHLQRLALIVADLDRQVELKDAGENVAADQ